MFVDLVNEVKGQPPKASWVIDADDVWRALKKTQGPDLFDNAIHEGFGIFGGFHITYNKRAVKQLGEKKGKRRGFTLLVLVFDLADIPVIGNLEVDEEVRVIWDPKGHILITRRMGLDGTGPTVAVVVKSLDVLLLSPELEAT